MTTTHAPAGVISASSDATGIHIVRVLDAPPELRVQVLDGAGALRDVVRRARIVDDGRRP